jgi:rare lipoprotein A
MANGKPLQDEALTCASWDYPFGTRLRILAEASGRSVEVTVTDRGPAKRLYKKGRIVDLSRAAFAKLAPLSCGIITVKIKEV